MYQVKVLKFGIFEGIYEVAASNALKAIELVEVLMKKPENAFYYEFFATRVNN